jgi:hypothetical protein
LRIYSFSTSNSVCAEGILAQLAWVEAISFHAPPRFLPFAHHFIRSRILSWHPGHAGHLQYIFNSPLAIDTLLEFVCWYKVHQLNKIRFSGIHLRPPFAIQREYAFEINHNSNRLKLFGLLSYPMFLFSIFHLLYSLAVSALYAVNCERSSLACWILHLVPFQQKQEKAKRL